MNETKMIQLTKEARRSVRDSRAKQYREVHTVIAIIRKYDPENAERQRLDLRGAVKQTQRNFPKHGLAGKRHRWSTRGYPVYCFNCGESFDDARTAEASDCAGRR